MSRTTLAVFVSVLVVGAAILPAVDHLSAAGKEKPAAADTAVKERDTTMTKKIKPTEEELRAKLTPEQYRVTQQCGTEPPFSGKYYYHKEDGMYRCVACGNPLFQSETKYESGSGWPSFWQPASENAIEEKKDTSHGVVRTEVVCGRCGAHLGHVFPDGPRPTGLRYCINSAALDFGEDTTEAKEEAEKPDSSEKK